MILYTFAALAIAGLVMTAIIQALLYGLRWYENVNRVFEPEISWIGALTENRFKPVRVYLWECAYLIIYAACFVPGVFRWVLRWRRSHFTPGEMEKGKPLTVLVHGLLGRPQHFEILRRRLLKSGVPNVVTFGYDSSTADIPGHAGKLRDFLIDIRRKTGMCDVILIGHSLGGLVVHQYARQYADLREVKAVLTLAAPFRGSRVSALAVTKAAGNLHPTNPMFAEIIAARLDIPFTSVYSKYDQLVIPYTNSQHPNADENMEIDFCGHTGYYFNRAVFRIVRNWTLKMLADPGIQGGESVKQD